MPPMARGGRRTEGFVPAGRDSPHAPAGIRDGLRRRPVATTVLASLLAIAAMAAFAPAAVPDLAGTPGAVGVAIAVLAALAAGPIAGVITAVVGWLAFFVLVTGFDELALVALPVWPLAAYAAGRLARAFAEQESEASELRRLDRAKTQFVSLASHEIRNPATVIAGLAATLHVRGSLLPPGQRAVLLQTLNEQARGLASLVEQLLDLSRLDHDALELQVDPFFVQSRVEEILLMAGVQPAAGVALDIPGDLRAEADPRVFDRIVSNLVTNAVRYGAPPVSIWARQDDRHFRLVVEDAGPGVADEFVPRLFERFAREEARPRQSGTGLGLAIAKSYARAHGGDLLYSHAEPTGARFELVIPQEP